MRLPVKITCVILIFALLTSCEAATENKDMPIKEEVTNFIDNFEAPESGDFTNSAYDAFIKEYPAGHCDIWSNGMISFYYYDPDSPKEYGRMYLDSNGKKVKSGGAGITCVKSYTGEENTPVDTTTVDTTNVDTTAGSTEEQSVEEKRLDEIEERLAEFEGESQSVKYNSPPVEDDSQSVEDVAHTVENVSQTVEDVAHTVENVATKVEEEEETKRNNGIREGMFVTVVGGVIVLFIELFLKRKRGRRSNL